MREQQGEGMEMQGMPEKYFTLWAIREIGSGATAPQFLEIFFEASTECVPLQNAACANFAKEKSEALVVERSDE